MKNRLVILLVLTFLMLATSFSAAQPRRGRRGEQNAAQYGWLSGLEHGKAEAKMTGKPMMVVIRCVP
jgi:hypothetical protein